MRSAVKWGALVGALAYLTAGLGVPLIADALFGTPDLSNPGVLIFGCLGIFTLLFGFSAAGYFTGRDTRNAGLGAISGVLALALYAALTALYTPRSGPSATSAASSARAGNALGQAIASIVADTFVFGLAALMGWLGGRPGAQKARRAHLASMQALTPQHID